MRRSASEVIRNLETRIARLERQASAFEYKTIASRGGRKVNLSRGETLFFAFVGFDGSIKPVSWKEWSKSRLPDQSVEFRKEGIKKALISKAKQSMGFAELMEVNDYRGDFTAVMSWLASKGISATARGVKVARLERKATRKVAGHIVLAGAVNVRQLRRDLEDTFGIEDIEIEDGVLTFLMSTMDNRQVEKQVKSLAKKHDVKFEKGEFTDGLGMIYTKNASRRNRY